MYKLIDSSSFFSPDEVQVSIVDLDSKSLVKQAADTRVQDYVKSISPVQGKMYLHINAMGAGEYFGANKNADYFPENNLLDYYKTFETSPAHVFRHHINKDPARAIGKVLFAVYNERMHRVELIAEVDMELGKDIEDKIAMGMYPSTSMACKTPYDVCSICGNKARTRQEYCSHLSTQLGRMLPNGKKVMAINAGPLKFFDISIVIKPADITSSVLQKVAHEESVSSVELADEAGLTDHIVKASSIDKLSEFIKEISDGAVVDSNPILDNILSKVKDPDVEIIEALKSVPLPEVLSAFVSLGMSPSLEFLAELIAHRELGEDGVGMGKHIKALMDEVGPKGLTLPKEDYTMSDMVSPLVIKVASQYLDQSSLFPEYVEKRASVVPGYGEGYAILGSGFVPSSRDASPVYNNPPEKSEDSGWITKLLGIGGAALLAKWFITNQIRDQLNREPRFMRPSNAVKIVLTKTASDNTIVSKLCKIAMERAVTETDTKHKDNIFRAALRTIESLGSSSQKHSGRIISVTAKVIRKGGDIILNDKKETPK
jgi:hypothetical protein